MKSNSKSERTRLLGRIEASEFVGRRAEIERIINLAAPDDDRRTARESLILLAAPTLGSSELLRQAYDYLFTERGDNATPVYFAFSRADRTAMAAARRFLHTFLLQFIAHRQDSPALIHAQPTIHDLLDAVSPSDHEWVEQLIEAFDRASASEDEHAFVRLCLSAPKRAEANGSRTIVMLDHLHTIEDLGGEDMTLGVELSHLIEQADTPFVLCGLRRRVMDVVCATDNRVENFSTLHLKPLTDGESRSFVEILSARHRVEVAADARDLLVQQCAGNPFYLASLVDAARESGGGITSFLDCQKLYVDELMGGRINRRFEFVIDKCAAPDAHARRSLLRLLHEAVTAPGGKFPAEAWRRKLGLDVDKFADAMRALHAYELTNFTTTFIEVEDDPVWRDYLRINHRLQVNAEPRALIVAETLLEILKRAPQTLERSRRRAASLDVADALARFDRQRIPASLLHYDRFVRMYKGADADEVAHGLDTEIDLVRLPQVVNAASCAAFHPPVKNLCDPERCTVAHGFEGDSYRDGAEIVWLAAEVEAAGEAGRGLAELWCDRLMSMARACRLRRVRLWLIAPEGFSAEASELLREREAYSSSRRQLEMLKERIGAQTKSIDDAAAGNEFEIAIPMGEDAELIAAQAVEQVARRSEFSSDAINQIKTALVEACINAEEQTPESRDRKIYQRFRIEDDRLIVTVSSRSLASGFESDLKTREGSDNGHTADDASGRRGWRLNLIRSLMDEVEFERGDDGTRLRMTKYLRSQESGVRSQESE